MPLIPKIPHFSILVCVPFFLCGCAGDGSTPEALRENPILRNAARAVLMGKIYDRAVIAERNGDSEAFAAAATELAKVDPLASAEQLVWAAFQLDMKAQKTEETAEKKQLEMQAAQKYRHALRVAPQFPSTNPDLLNALGYFLADRGKSRTDFQTAERLTRAALKSLDKSVADMENAPITNPLLPSLKYTRAIVRDSLAWALFRLGKFKDAKTEQIAAIKEAEAFAPNVRQAGDADLYFHLGKIELELKNTQGALQQFEKALKIKPDHEPTLNALKSFLPKTPPQSKPQNNAPPKPEAEEPIPDVNNLNGALEARSTPDPNSAIAQAL